MEANSPNRLSSVILNQLNYLQYLLANTSEEEPEADKATTGIHCLSNLDFC